MVGSRHLSVSKSLGTVVPISHTPQVPCSKVTSGIKPQDQLSAPSHWVGQDRQPWHQPQHKHSLANLAEMPRTMGTTQTWHPSAGYPSAPSKIKDWRGCWWCMEAACDTAPQWGLCAWMSSNAGLHKTQNFLSPRQCCEAGKGCYCPLPSLGRSLKHSQGSIHT